MIEFVDNAIQLAVLAVCFALSVIRAVHGRERMWVTLSFFYGCSFFSLAYWTCYLAVYGHSPSYSYAPDLGWMASYIFLVILLVEFDSKRPAVFPMRIAWIMPAVCIPLCILFCTHGDILLNLVDCSLMAAIGYFSIRGIAASSHPNVSKGWALHVATLSFAIVELLLWTTSCFWGADTLTPYVVSDFVFTASFMAILACAWKIRAE